MRGPDNFRRMSHTERKRELFGDPDPGPTEPTPPASLTRDVERDVALVYFRAAHEAARKERRQWELDNYEGAAVYRNLAERHLAAYRDEKPDDLHRGGVRR